MPTRLVCLANSFKEGGRCVAGIELDNSNAPIIKFGPKWIRPVCHTAHGEIPTNLVAHLNLLDIIEIDITGYPEELDYQSENVFFAENAINIIGKYSTNELHKLCDKRMLIFENKGKSVSEELIEELSYSLMFVNISQFNVTEKKYEDAQHKPQVRLEFFYKGNPYDLPITDPMFLHTYRVNPQIIKTSTNLYLTLSLGILHNNWHYKLVAGIISN